MLFFWQLKALFNLKEFLKRKYNYLEKIYAQNNLTNFTILSLNRINKNKYLKIFKYECDKKVRKLFTTEKKF